MFQHKLRLGKEAERRSGSREWQGTVERGKKCSLRSNLWEIIKFTFDRLEGTSLSSGGILSS